MTKVRFAILLTLVVSSYVSSSAQSKKNVVLSGQPISVRAFFPDFPPVSMGMSFEAAKKAVAKAGYQPASLGDSKDELAWDGTFAGMSGRATMFFKPKTGAWEIAVVAAALEKQREIFRRWDKKIAAKHGRSKEITDDSIAVSHVWRFKNGTALELRMPKDVESPVVDIHWVIKTN